MADTYTLTLHNASSQPGLTFAVYTVAPVGNTAGQFPVAWLTKPLNEGNQVTFAWTLDYAVMFATQGGQAGTVWKESSTVDVKDTDAQLNSALLDYQNNDYVFQHNAGAHPVKPGEVYINTSATVPPWTLDAGPSVGLAISGGESGQTPTMAPAIVGNSGPNLVHTFDLHPTYYIDAGNIVQGAMADLDTVTQYQQVTYGSGVFAAEWTLDKSNNWVEGPPPRNS
ncbi:MULTISPECIES: hypothetical protein [Streptomyces]|uniref:Uncharacterized protein n=1 Tax=Streptomyces ramulosus TaxID=47762 RepID=A0ABW1FLC0_9ACTN